MAAVKKEPAGKAGDSKSRSTAAEAPDGTGGGKNAIRLLRAGEIECRAGVVNEKGLSLLLFKDARVDQWILDEAFTPFGWKRTHQDIDGNLYCTVEVWDAGKNQWIAKQDVGVPGRWEKENAVASDSFKRACFNWGIGRELYTAPFIWVPSGVARIEKKGDAYTCPDHFSVHSIAYNGQREITGLVIINSKGRAVFSMGQGETMPVQTEGQEGAISAPGQAGGRGAARPAPAQTGKQEGARPIPGQAEGQGGARPTPAQPGKQEETGLTPAQMGELTKELARTGVTMEAVLGRYQIQDPGQMTDEIYARALNSLKKTKAKRAA